MCFLLIGSAVLYFSPGYEAGLARSVVDSSHIAVIGQDTFYVGNITPVYIYSPRIFTEEEKREYQKYVRLVYNVKRAYPYAKIAAQVYRQVDDSVRKIPSKKLREEYVARVEAELKQRYEPELRKLTITQGRILIKLFYRETGNTTFDAVKEFRGSFEAFFWQALARVFGSNLKARYDPEGEDRDIEEIVRMIEAGAL
ncbi:MAG: DUF4294 domain-containing protein [Bacteroidales bacterium]